MNRIDGREARMVSRGAFATVIAAFIVAAAAAVYGIVTKKPPFPVQGSAVDTTITVNWGPKPTCLVSGFNLTVAPATVVSWVLVSGGSAPVDFQFAKYGIQLPPDQQQFGNPIKVDQHTYSLTATAGDAHDQPLAYTIHVSGGGLDNVPCYVRANPFILNKAP